MQALAEKTAKNLDDIVRLAIKHSPASKALVVFDAQTPLARLLTEGYRVILPEAQFLDYDEAGTEAILTAINALSPNDLVVLVQSSSFRLNEFRIRIELFQRGLATIDHLHLERAVDETQISIYIDALAYDPAYYSGLGRRLKERVDKAQTITVHCDGTTLTYEGGMEPAKLNVGDYADMKNIGGTFPIGEVFSEPKDLTMVNGEAMIYAFAGMDHLIQIHTPFKVKIEKGILTAEDVPAAFREVLDRISEDEDEVLVREFGLGLNPAMGKHAMVSDITAFERQKGLHLSLGEKHGVYKKPGLIPKKTHFHIDVFVDPTRIEADGEIIYADGEFLV